VIAKQERKSFMNMYLWLSALERLALALVFGGGVIMSSCVRPILLQALSAKGQTVTAVATTIDGIRVHSWERYNRMAFIAVVVLVIVEVIRSISVGGVAYIAIGLSLFLGIALVRKMIVDHRLKTRLLLEASASAPLVGSSERRELEVLSISILILSSILMLWPVL
jgi:hypothetical protein